MEDSDKRTVYIPVYKTEDENEQFILPYRNQLCESHFDALAVGFATLIETLMILGDVRLGDPLEVEWDGDMKNMPIEGVPGDMTIDGTKISVYLIAGPQFDKIKKEAQEKENKQ